MATQEVTFEKCPVCKTDSVVQRSSYKLCHHCGEVFKPEWRKMVDEDAGRLLSADVIAAKQDVDEEFYVVQWVRRDGNETGTHLWSKPDRAFILGHYFSGEAMGEEASADYDER